MKRFCLAAALLLGATGCRSLFVARGASDELPKYGGEQAPGAYQFVFNDLHGLTSDTMNRRALPWKIGAASLIAWRNSQGDHWPETEAGADALLQRRYGFMNVDRIDNWPYAGPAPKLTKPLGLVSGYVEKSFPKLKIEATNQGCTTCHASNLWDENGQPKPHDAWIGLSSSSIDLGRYADDIYASFVYLDSHKKEVLALESRMFPAMDPVEKQTIESFVLPTIQKKMDKLQHGIRRFQPYDPGGAGLTNGVAAMKVSNGFVKDDKFMSDEVGFTSIPDFGAVGLKRGLLSDAVFAPPGKPRFGPLPAKYDLDQHIDDLGGVVAEFTISTLGDDPRDAPDNVPAARQIVRYLVTQYRSPPFPGHVDRALAQKGRAIYDAQCASCHGTYDDADHPRLRTYPNYRTTAMHTDPARWQLTHGPWSADVAASPMGPYVEGQETEGYLAPPLTALWATAPYLHNGSVPTLWHLMHPAERPKKFQVGGHALDFEKVGIAGHLQGDTYVYPDNYQPWMIPDLYDTTKPGHSNAGHEKPFDSMSEDDKRALIEFLKEV